MNIRSRKGNFMFQVIWLIVLASSALVSALGVCNSKECQNLVAAIQANRDLSVDPCQDYFQHACGNFIKNNPPPIDRATYSTLVAYSVELKEKLCNLLEEPERPDDSRSAKAVKRQYKFCKNEDAREAAGLTTLLNVINTNGGWPMIVPDVFPYRKKVLEVQDEYNRLTGNGPLYTVLVYSRTPASTDNAITLDQPASFPTKEYNVLDPANAPKFVNYISNVAAEFAKASGVTIPRDRINKDAQDVYDFHVKLSKLRDDNLFRPRGESLKVSDAQEAIKNGTSTSFDLLTALQRLYREVSGVTVTKDEVINVRELEYMQELVKLLPKTSPATVLNYMHFHFVEPYLPLTTRNMRKLVNEMYDLKPVNRTVDCLAQPNIHTALSRMFVKRYVPPSAKLVAENVLNDLKTQIKVQIERSSFIDAKVRPKALAKLDNLISIVGYTDLFDSDEKVDQVHAKYRTGGDLVENILSYDEVEYRKRLEALRVPINHTARRTNFQMSAILEGSSYSLNFNRLGLPSSLLGTPLFSENYPAMSNLVGLGQIIGGRLADMYTYIGTQFDDQGKMTPWAKGPVFTEFEKRDQCFIDQYSASIIKELADTSQLWHKPVLARYQFALKSAYLAHQANMKPLAYRAHFGTRIERLPMPEPIDKQFFLNFANTYCQSANPQKLAVALNNEIPHDPTSRLKVNSALANFPEFSKAYGCPSGTPMNPVTKCSTLD